ncbi:hypothetical protein [Motilibacter deserti]|uniref:Acyl-CoA dehydrogenase-like protein n=1 Tax=Motilibacter deserti TaxID=2714956 RepID=A0ABX0GTI6_9ACTN|nr:hypothetical protein [Motilibacter deserti]NHC14107.1 hypothetical protein [Motilibacter deserti]
MLELPRSARLAAWGGAVLRGDASPDDAVDAVVGDDTRHVVTGLSGADGEVGLALALGLLRVERAGGLALALPVPGDPRGLGGPAEFTTAAVDAGEAVVSAGSPDGTAYGLLPEVAALGSSGTMVRWHARPVRPVPLGALPGLREAEAELTAALREATEELVRLDVARWRPEVGEALLRLRSAPQEDGLGPGYSPRARRVLGTAQRVAAIAALATEEPGAAVSAGQMRLRSAALDRLAEASRRAVVAAVNSPLEPAG